MKVQVGNKYELEAVIGRGKFGTVYRARHRFTKASVAIKVEDKTQGTLVKEARIYRLLRDIPGICKLYDFGIEGKYSYMAISYLTRPAKALSLELLRNSIPSLITTLRYLHEQGVVHCDIKPDNIIIPDRGDPHIIDFGLSRYGPPVSLTLRSVVGSHPYASRRVLQLKPPTASDDVESFILSVANLAGFYGQPFDRAALPEGFQRLIAGAHDIIESNDYQTFAKDINTLLEKLG